MYNEEYLAHYGVKGMKWGVRRAIGQKAKIAADLERRETAYKKRGDYKTKQAVVYDKVTGSRQNKEQKARSKELHANADAQYKAAKQMNKYRNEAIKNLSTKDIEQGRKYLLKANAVGVIVAGPIGAGIATGHDVYRTNKFIREQESKNK